MMKTAYVFPGQGSQYIGMGAAFVEMDPLARELLDEADAALGFSLRRIFLEGSSDQLRLTYYTQPAILTVSVMAYRMAIKAGFPVPDFALGHSLGEYSALVAAEVLDFPDAIRLVYLRGRFMDEAVPSGIGAMAAVLGADLQALSALCSEIARELSEVVEIANENCPGQVVVSGHKAAVSRLVERAKEAGAKRAIPLEVSGPFHSSLMAPAAVRLAEELAKIELRKAAFPIVANVSAEPLSDPSAIRSALIAQIEKPVLFEAGIRQLLRQNVQTFVEMGPGSVLSGLIKKIDRQAIVQRVEDQGTFAQAKAAILEVS
ncbi:malonyl CoA-ACP transacylase [Ferroacidibacillus organovorans]|uniref:Malonyl CoA-acyl carrier protein transacylase n=2 Tax=Ferroacidibacillus organovorans TaxID=1765683 RepID=A0A101XQC0_9BACL|nr:malonyl CoA-ACP transacylase [Ferroacidibacillus organovorans]